MNFNIVLCFYFIFFIGVLQCQEETSRTGYDTVDTFEFVPVNNVGDVTFSTTGSIGVLDKNVRVPIVVPRCSVLTYIRVDVDNKVGPPFVSMDFDMSTVVIQYRPAQFSISSYVVTAKSLRKPHCDLM